MHRSLVCCLLMLTLIITRQLSSTFCVSPCTVATATSAFILTSETVGSSTPASTCTLDFLIFIGSTSAATQADRYCGERLSPSTTAVTTSVTSLCCKLDSNANSPYHYPGSFTYLILIFLQLRSNHTVLSTKPTDLKLQQKLLQMTILGSALLTPSHRREALI